MDNVFLTDVLGQPEAMRASIDLYRGYGEAFKRIAALRFDRVIFAGMGSSHYCSLPAAIKLSEHGIPATVYAASELLYYEWNTIGPDTLLVLISQSGESGEIVDMLKKLPDTQTVVGITNDPNSALGRRADVCLEMRVAPELAVSTRTYLASLILCDMLAETLTGRNMHTSLARSALAVDALEAFLANHKAMQSQIGTFFGHPATLCYIGRGPAVATAESGALFTRETAKYPALAFDSAEFRHGPYEMVDETFCAVIYAPSGKTLDLQQNLTRAIIEHGGRVAFVTDADVDFDSDRVLVLRHPSVPEEYAPLVQVAVPQLFANDMAIHRGFAPGVFRQSSKITTAQ